MARHRSSAAPLALAVRGADRLREPVSVHRLARCPGVPLLAFLAAAVAALVDRLRPRRQPARLPAARRAAVRRAACAAARRRGARRSRWRSARHAAVARRWRCCRTSCRSACRRTSTRRSTSLGTRARRRARRCCCTRAAASSAGRRCATAGSSRRSAGGLALLLLWPIGLLFPPPVPLGLGQVLGARCASGCGRLLDGHAGRAPWLRVARGRRRCRAQRAVAAPPSSLVVALGLLAPCLVAFTVVARRLAPRACWCSAPPRSACARDDPVDRAELRPRARAGLAHAAGAAGAGARAGCWRCCCSVRAAARVRPASG